MHAASFLQWGITQQSQPGGSFIKGTERWSRLLYSPMETMGVCGEHENLVKSPYFLHKRPVGYMCSILPCAVDRVYSSCQEGHPRFFFFQLQMPAISSHQALQMTSLLRHTDPPWRGSHFFLILSEEKETNPLKLLGKYGASMSIKRSKKKVQKHNV